MTTKANMALAALTEKGADADLLRDMVQYVAQRMMEMDAEGLCAAAYGARSVDRENSRNGYRERPWETRAVSQEPCIQGVSTRSVDERVNPILRSLTRRGLRGVKPVISDSHQRLKAAVAMVLKATWPRCETHFLRYARANAGKGQRQMVLAMINTVFARASAETTGSQWRTVTDPLRAKLHKLAAMMEKSAADVLAFMHFPKAHQKQIHSTNPLERVNAAVKRRTDVVGIFPKEAAITRLVGALLLDPSDEGSLQRRCVPLEGLLGLTDNQTARLSTVGR